jgi:hypothetical protein
MLLDHQVRSYIAQYGRNQNPNQLYNFLPFVLFFAMMYAFLLLDAVLPLRDLKFTDALLTHVAPWTLWPTSILFPHRPVTAFVPVIIMANPPTVMSSWKETALLLGVFLNAFLLYLLALRLLPRRISLRYVLISTLLLGILCVFIPIVTSTDVYSYIAYARMAVIYHLNPLTTVPTAIHTDPVYGRLYWLKQPSAYGPTWALVTCLLQWLAISVGFNGILSMLLSLRIFGLAMHLGSTWLIWSISGHIQRRYGFISPEKRLLGVLAFAWNPLLLLEACVNAHNDASLLFFVLLAIWMLVRKTPITTRIYLLAAVMFALATSLKLYVVLLAPVLLLFLWIQPRKFQNTVGALATYLGIVLLLYAPFWEHGAILKVFLVNPTAFRNINSPAEFLSYLFNGIYYALVSVGAHHPITTYVYIGSSAELVAHILGIGVFVIIYGLVFWRAARHAQHHIGTFPGLIRWLALVWLLYCVIGAPWFWPWYAVTFFGLYALLEATSEREPLSFGFLRQPLTIRLLAFSLLTLYCFFGWGSTNSAIPGLPGFLCAYLRGLWVWALPLLAICLHLKPIVVSRSYKLGVLQGKGVRASIQRELSEVQDNENVA